MSVVWARAGWTGRPGVRIARAGTPRIRSALALHEPPRNPSRPGEAHARGPGAEVERRVGARRHVRVRPLRAPRADLLDRHAAADRQRLAARRARVLLHAHRRRRPLPAHARARGVLPDGLGRQRAADRASRAEPLRRALRSLRGLRPGLRAAGAALGEGAGRGLPPQLRRAVPATDRGATSAPSKSCGGRSVCRSTGR